MKVTLEIEVDERSKRAVETALGLENMTQEELEVYLAHQVYRYFLTLEDRTIVVTALKAMRDGEPISLPVPP